MFFKTIVLVFLILLPSCKTQIGRFTNVSTQNVRGFEHVGKDRSQISSSVGKSCTHRIYVTRVAVGVFTLGLGWFMPSFDITLGDDDRDRLTNSVDDAIKQAKLKGVFDGDVLQNATIKERTFLIPLLYSYKCTIADGDVVSSVTKKVGF